MSTLPRPFGGVSPEYIQRLVAAVEQALSRQVRKTNGVVVVSNEQPVGIISPNGTVYRLKVDDAGNLSTEEMSL